MKKLICSFLCMVLIISSMNVLTGCRKQEPIPTPSAALKGRPEKPEKPDKPEKSDKPEESSSESTGESTGESTDESTGESTDESTGESIEDSGEETVEIPEESSEESSEVSEEDPEYAGAISTEFEDPYGGAQNPTGELVYEQYRACIEIEGRECWYYVPAIMGEAFADLNQALREEYVDVFYREQVLDPVMESGYSPCIGLDYKWAENDELVSFYIEKQWDFNSVIEIDTYTFYKDTGEMLTNEDVAAYFGLERDTYLVAIEDWMGSVFADSSSYYVEENGFDSIYLEMMTRNISPEYVGRAQLYMGGDGELWVWAPIASWAGPTYIWMNFEGFYPMSDDYYYARYGAM